VKGLSSLKVDAIRPENILSAGMSLQILAQIFYRLGQ